MIAFLAQWVVSGIVVAAAAACVIPLVPVGAPAERHRLWWAALLAVLALPLVWAWSAPSATGASADPGSAVAALGETAPLFSVVAPSWLAPLLVGAWATWSTVSLVRLGCGVAALRRLLHTTTDLSPQLDSVLVARVARVRGAQIVGSGSVDGACAVGFFRPRIVLGTRLLDTLDAAALDAVVRHEAAHLERYDDWAALARQLIVAGAGFHPAVWFITRQIEAECEASCDRLVVDGGGDPVQYARALTAVAELTMAARRRVMLAPGVLSRRGRLSQRVLRVVTTTPVCRTVRRTLSVVGVLLVCGVTTLAASIPTVVVLAAERTFADLATLPASALARVGLPRVESRRWSPGTAQRRASAASVVSPPASSIVIQASEPQSSPALAPALAVADPIAAGDDVLADGPMRHHTLTVPSTVAAVSDEAASIGARTSRAGVATGAAFGRAGRSVGRFFSNGGRAVSNRF